MDYEHRHKEVLDAIKKLQEANPSDDGIQNWVNENFPELAESEDEKIRKELIYDIAKQGEQTDKIVERAKTEKQRVLITESDGEANIDWDTRSLQDVKLLLEYGLDYINKLDEKNCLSNTKSSMGDLKIISSLKDIIYGYWNSLPDSALEENEVAESCYRWLEKQGKQPPADKVESKFHEGDWVILTAGELSTTLQIVNVDTSKRLYWFNDRSYLPIVDEECLHLWSIEDAKDGDVLYFSDETIVIFKDLYNATTFHSYCHIEDGIFNISKDDMPDWWEAEGFKPATKEQCGVLFQKMKESGYEWNNEKKELLEIEEELTDFEKSLKHIMIETLECGDTRNLKADAEMLLRLAQEPKEWSEEDEEHLNSIISDIKTDMGAYPRSQEVIDIYNDDISFLKSLRDRVQPQPKQEWCEEDEKKIDRAIWLIDHYATHGHDKKLREDVISGLESLKRK